MCTLAPFPRGSAREDPRAMRELARSIGIASRHGRRHPVRLRDDKAC
jgi:hypothetical protein